MMRIEGDIQTDHARQLSAEQLLAVDVMLASAPGCGLHRLSVEELVALCEHFGAAIDHTERQSWRSGWNAGWQSAIEFLTTSRLIKSDRDH